MQLHNLHKNKAKKSKRVGRGGKRGTYSGKGIKGQKSRAGRKLQPPMRELIKRFPKLAGYRNNPKSDKDAIVNLFALEKKFKDGERVTPDTLLAKGIIKKQQGRTPKVKILGKGKLSKKLVFENVSLSKTVQKNK